MKIATKEFLADFEALCEKRKKEIRETKDIDPRDVCGYTYYVSNDGCDENDGMTPETPWKTLEKVGNTKLFPGECVRFRRGDIFRGTLSCQAGVTYTGYASSKYLEK